MHFNCRLMLLACVGVNSLNYATGNSFKNLANLSELESNSSYAEFDSRLVKSGQKALEQTRVETRRTLSSILSFLILGCIPLNFLYIYSISYECILQSLHNLQLDQ